jgi:SAM-dependent methyltransferase
MLEKLGVISIATTFRKSRFRLFESLIAPISKPVHILDVGGTQGFWQTMLSSDAIRDVTVTILNSDYQQVTLPNFTSMVGDARDLSIFRDKSFDVVFSNSVIEHVGQLQDQTRMATEIRRVGKRYFVQTPNRYFPIEPHFLFPFFQFLPVAIKIELLRRFTLGWYPRTPDYREARSTIERESARLLTRRDMLALFPAAALYKEKMAGLTKSFIVYDGWT